MRICKFKKPAPSKIDAGVWSPVKREFHAFADVEELCIPCYRWRYLQLLRGSKPIWGRLLKNPVDIDEDITGYAILTKKFVAFITSLLRLVARSAQGSSVFSSIRSPGLLLEAIKGEIEPSDLDEKTMEYVSQCLSRLDDDGELVKYKGNSNVLFNARILNETFDIYRTDSKPIALKTVQRAIGTAATTTPQETFRWSGPLGVNGEIPILDLDSYQIRKPACISDEFFSPPLDLSVVPAKYPGIHALFIQSAFHQMWILREALAQLVDDQMLPQSLTGSRGNVLFKSDRDLSQIDFRRFEIVVDAIDRSYTMPKNLSFKQETGQAAIIYNLLYSNSPGLIHGFGQDCIVRINQPTPPLYSCPLDRTLGCGMSDRRVKNQSFPRDRSEVNIHKFLRLLRDETVFSHILFYRLSAYYLGQTFKLNQYQYLWIGSVEVDNNGDLTFTPNMPSGWFNPEVSDDKYEICLLSPFCYETGMKVSFERKIGIKYIIRPHEGFNPWLIDLTFSNPHQCIIGDFTIDENLMNENRQKHELVRGIQFESNSSTMKGLAQSQKEAKVLEKRLDDRGLRIGEATFGKYVRFV